MSQHYTVGGTINQGIYLRRQADEELLRLCQESQFAYVLTSRQMGKSSLMVSTTRQLVTLGIRPVTIDLQDLGTQSTAEQWYLGLLVAISDQLALTMDVLDWWQERSHLGMTQRWTLWFREVLLAEIVDPIVVFVDEIDSTLNLPYTDDFFIAIRSFYTARSQHPVLNRLSFVLLGVATPDDLIADTQRTPFNIGQQVAIGGFQLEEALPLAQGLAAANPEAVLAEVLAWTGGQPLLTQKVCAGLANGEEISVGEESERVAEWIRSHIVTHWESQDNPVHLKTIRARLLAGGERLRGRVLGICQRVLQQEVVLGDDSLEQMGLRLSGLMVKQGDRLQIASRLYGEVFNLGWIGEELAQLRSYAGALRAWEESGRSDESRLLRGNALAEVLAWAQDKRLDEDDRQFFEACQAIERREMEGLLAAEREANWTLADANRKARRRIKVGSGILVGTLVLSAIAAVYAGQVQEGALRDRARAEQKVTEADQRRKAAEEEVNKKLVVEANARLAVAKAKLEVAKARTEQAKIQNQSRQQIAAAKQQEAIARAGVVAAQQRESQANLAVAAAQKQKDSAVAQARSAQALTASAQVEQQKAEQSSAAAQKAATLEQKGTALLRSQPIAFQNMDTLLEALEVGQELRQLLQEQGVNRTKDLALTRYPTRSPMLALRMAVNLVLEQDLDRYPRSNATGDRILHYSSRDNRGYVTDASGNRLNELQGSNPYFNRAGDRIFTASPTGGSYGYDASGNRLFELQGSNPSFNQTGDRILTFSPEGDRNYVYDALGNLLNQFQGGRASLNQTGNRILVASPEGNRYYVYDASGNRLNELQGSDPRFNRAGDRILSSGSEGDRGYVYDASGNLLNELQGGNLSLNETQDSSQGSSQNDRILTSSEQDNRSYIYDRSGNRLLELQGIYPRFNQGNDRIFTSSSQRQDERSYVYDISGNRLLELEGTSLRFSQENDRILTSSYQNNRSYIYDTSGTRLLELQGGSPRSNQKGDRILTTSYQNNRSYMYDASGNFLFELQGLFPRFNEATNRILTDSFPNDRSYVYDLSGNLLLELQGGNPSLMGTDNSRQDPKPERILTYSREDNRSYAYSIGSQVSSQLKVSGNVFNIENHQIFFSSPSQRNRSYLYDTYSNSLRELQGTAPSLNEAGDRILTYSEASNNSYIYDISGDRLLELQGIFLRFNQTGDRILTFSRQDNRL
jgi:hypothetical protein